MTQVLVSTTSFKQDPFEDVLEVFALMNWKEVDINLFPFMEKGYSGPEMAKLIKDLGLVVGYASGGWCDFFHSSEEGFENTLSSVNKQIEFAHHLDIDRLRLFFGRLAREDFDSSKLDTIVSNIGLLGQKYPEIRFSFENHDGASLDPMVVWEIISAVNLPNVGLTFDPINYAKVGVDPLPALDSHFPKVFHMHVKGLTDDFKFCEYGAGGFSYISVLEKLKGLGYSGGFTLEYEGEGHPVMRSFRSHIQLIRDLKALGFEVKAKA